MGGYLTIYITKDYDIQAAKYGALSGVLGAFLIGLLALMGIGIITAFMNLISTNIGSLFGFIGILGSLFFTLILLMIFGVLGDIGGVLAETMQKYSI